MGLKMWAHDVQSVIHQFKSKSFTSISRSQSSDFFFSHMSRVELCQSFLPYSNPEGMHHLQYRNIINIRQCVTYFPPQRKMALFPINRTNAGYHNKRHAGKQFHHHLTQDVTVAQPYTRNVNGK